MNGTAEINASTPNNASEAVNPQEAFWNEVWSYPEYKASKAMGQYVLIIIYIVGTIGNAFSLAVMSQRSMRASSTAFYMVILAIADNAVLLTGCLKRWVYEVFEEDLLNQSAAACYIVNFLQYWSFDIAAWVLVAMTIDRAIVVTAPLKAQLYATKTRAIIATVLVAVMCAGINLHLFVTTEYIRIEAYDMNLCTAKEQYRDFHQKYWSLIDAAVYSFIPFLLLLILNIIIVVSMSRANVRKRKMTTNFQTKRKDEQRNTINPTKLTIMLLSVTCAFIILTGPAMILHIVRETSIDTNTPEHMAKYILTRQVSRILLYLNHSINFFLYCLTGTKFRRELVALLKCQSARERQRRMTMRTSMASITTGVTSMTQTTSMQSTD